MKEKLDILKCHLINSNTFCYIFIIDRLIITFSNFKFVCRLSPIIYMWGIVVILQSAKNKEMWFKENWPLYFIVILGVISSIYNYKTNLISNLKSSFDMLVCTYIYIVFKHNNHSIHYIQRFEKIFVILLFINAFISLFFFVPYSISIPTDGVYIGIKLGRLYGMIDFLSSAAILYIFGIIILMETDIISQKYCKLWFISLFIIYVFLDKSRNGYICLILLFILYFAKFVHNERSLLKQILSLSVLVAVDILIIFCQQKYLLNDPYFIQFAASSNQLNNVILESREYPNGISNGRVELWECAVKLLGLHPIFGIGTNNFKIYAINAGVDKRLTGDHPHSGYFTLLLSTGIFSVIPIATLIIKCLRRIKQIIKYFATQNGTVLIIIVMTVFASIDWEIFFTSTIQTCIFWAALGLFANKGFLNGEEENDGGKNINSCYSGL